MIGKLSFPFNLENLIPLISGDGRFLLVILFLDNFLIKALSFFWSIINFSKFALLFFISFSRDTSLFFSTFRLFNNFFLLDLLFVIFFLLTSMLSLIFVIFFLLSEILLFSSFIFWVDNEVKNLE